MSLIEEKETYTSTEVKIILADLIGRNGYDSAAVCRWNGVDSITVQDWNEELNKVIEEHYQRGRRQGIYFIGEVARKELEPQ